jgi:hypothetical protein
MKCAVCLWLASQDPLAKLVVGSAETTIHGTALCRTHAMERLQSLSVLQELGLR